MPPMHLKVDNDGIKIKTVVLVRCQTAPAANIIPLKYKLNLTLKATVLQEGTADRGEKVLNVS